MEINEYLTNALKTWTKDPIQGRCLYAALGLSNEVGEVLGKLKKEFRDRGGEFSEEMRRAMADELGDVLWYLTIFGHELGYTLEDIAKMNNEKLSSRATRNQIKGDGDNR